METVNKPKPDKPCYCCNSMSWYWNKNSKSWCCGKCHPNPEPENYAEPDYPGKGKPGQLLIDASVPGAKAKYVELRCQDSEIEALRSRVAQGNFKLIMARLKIRQMQGDELDRNHKAWGESVDKLRALGMELEAKGYDDCLYLTNGKKEQGCLTWPEGMACIVCPAEKGDKKYWVDELMALPHPEVRNSKSIEFYSTVGGLI